MSGGLACALVNVAWAASALPEHRRLRRSASDVSAAQEDVLRQVLRLGAGSRYGRRHDFSRLRSPREFQQAVPLTTHDDYRPDLERIGRGEAGVLTTSPVLRLLPTGGSTSGVKLVPFTRALRAQIDRAVAAWVADLFLREPAVMRGRAYWSVSPAGSPSSTASVPGTVAVGFEDDASYLGSVARRLAPLVQAVPGAVRRVEDLEAWRYLTVAFLLGHGDLSFVSVWNPWFLRVLLEAVPAYGEHVADDLCAGRLRPPGRVRPEAMQVLNARWGGDARRGGEVRAALARERDPAARHRRLWPGLRVVSCWADAHARGAAVELATLLPQARVQPKGLLATEGVVSVPLGDGPGAVLAVRSHFFEFLIEGEASPGTRPRLAHELSAGDTCSVVMTTGGGLYRYRLGDLVHVVGFEGGCPRLELVGRRDLRSDRVGEKLDECQVRRALSEVFVCAPSFALVAWEAKPAPGRYALFAEGAGDDDGLRLAAERLDRALRENPAYAYARDLGQLRPVAAFRVEGGGREAFLARGVREGRKLGDIKPAALDLRDGWGAVLEGRWLAAAADPGHPTDAGAGEREESAGACSLDARRLGADE